VDTPYCFGVSEVLNGGERQEMVPWPVITLMFCTTYLEGLQGLTVKNEIWLGVWVKTPVNVTM
jgi:hypothetical protein